MPMISDVLRLTHTMGLSRRQVAEATGVYKSTVGDYIRRAKAAGITWPIADGLGDAELELRLFPIAGETTVRAEPDWPRIHAELKWRGVTLVLLWQEYQAEHPGGYSSSRFCELFDRWRAVNAADARGRRQDVRRCIGGFAKGAHGYRECPGYSALGAPPISASAFAWAPIQSESVSVRRDSAYV